MTYALGLDIGTTYIAAAIFRDGTVESLSLDNYRVSIPSAVFVSGDEMVFGETALRRGAVEPTGLAREFKRRLGDPVPIVMDGSPYHADRLSALLTAWVVEGVCAQLGSTPTHTVITHPANWTEFQLNLLRGALRDVGLTNTSFMSEPAAAALDFASASTLAEGDMVLVYDLGGGTFDVALLRYEHGAFEHAIETFGIERLGGIDFDQALFDHVLGHLPDEVLDQARDSTEGRAALAQLRRSVVEAKESLSSDVAADIPVVLPGSTSSIRVTRQDFERMIRPMVRQTIEGIRTTLARAGLSPTDLSAVLLVGGSSRIPLIPDLVTDELGLPVRIDVHPKLVVAKGAARQAATFDAAEPPGPVRSEGRSRIWLVVAAVVVAAVGAVLIGTQLLSPDESAGSEESGDQPGTAGPAGTVTGTGSDTDETASPSTGTETTSAPSTAPEVTTPPVPFGVGDDITTNGLPLGIEVSGGEVFVASLVSNQLQRFALGDGAPVAGPAIQLPDEPGVRTRGNDVLATDDALYMSLHTQGTVAVIDTASATVDSVDVGGNPLDFALADDGTVWTSVLIGSDPDTRTGALVPIVGTSAGEPVPLPEEVGALATDGDTLFFVHYEAEQVGRLDLETLEPTVFDVEGSPADVAVVDGELWVTLRDLDQVAVLDPDTFDVIDRIDVGADPHKVLVALDSVWVTNETLPPWGPDKTVGSVSRIDPVTRAAVQEPIEVGLAPIGLATDGVAIYVTNHHGPIGGDLPAAEYATSTDAEQRDLDEEYTQSGAVSILTPDG